MRKDVQFVDADTIKILALAEHVDDVVFKRSKFEASLFTPDTGASRP